MIKISKTYIEPIFCMTRSTLDMFIEWATNDVLHCEVYDVLHGEVYNHILTYNVQLEAESILVSCSITHGFVEETREPDTFMEEVSPPFDCMCRVCNAQPNVSDKIGPDVYNAAVMRFVTDVVMPFNKAYPENQILLYRPELLKSELERRLLNLASTCSAHKIALNGICGKVELTDEIIKSMAFHSVELSTARTAMNCLESAMKTFDGLAKPCASINAEQQIAQ